LGKIRRKEIKIEGVNKEGNFKIKILGKGGLSYIRYSLSIEIFI